VRRVLAHASFRRLWASQLVSQTGDRLTLVVLALAVTEIGSATDVGFVLAARYVPLVALLLLGGVYADRLPRRAVMIAADLARFGLHALLAALFLAGVVDVWQVIVIEALFACAEAFSIPAHQGLIPQTVPEGEIQQATALSNLARNMTQLVGPAAGTAIYVGAGAGAAFLVDALSFAVGAWLLLGVSARPRGTGGARLGVRRELADGFRHVRARPWLWVTVLNANLYLLFAEGPFNVLGPTRSQQAYGAAERYGIAVTILGAGLLIGTLVSGRMRPRRPLVVAYLALLPLSLAYLAFALGAPFILVAALFLLGGVGGSVFDVLWFTAVVEHVPPDALSRVSSFDYMGSFASMPLGLVLAGPVAAATSSTAVLLAGATVGVLVSATALASRAIRGFAADPVHRLESAPLPGA
jgi:MFS family permease